MKLIMKNELALTGDEIKAFDKVRGQILGEGIALVRSKLQGIPVAVITQLKFDGLGYQMTPLAILNNPELFKLLEDPSKV